MIIETNRATIVMMWSFPLSPRAAVLLGFACFSCKREGEVIFSVVKEEKVKII